MKESFGLNRTRVELKRNKGSRANPYWIRGLNRTRVELKHCQPLDPYALNKCLNRTRVELKQLSFEEVLKSLFES